MPPASNLMALPWLAKAPLFALIPSLSIFRAHQSAFITPPRHSFPPVRLYASRPSDPPSPPPASSTTVSSALQWAINLLESAGVPDASLSAEYLMLHSLGLPPTPRSALTRLASSPMPSPAMATFKALCDRRLSREPLQYLVGNWDFHRITLDVRPPLLIPRPETEELVELVLGWEGGLSRSEPWRLLDIGVGTGAIGLALLHSLPRATCVGIDPNPLAVELALSNAKKLGVGDRYECVQCGIDEYEGGGVEEGGSFDAIVSNPPYIPARQLPGLMDEVRRYEDPGALDGGEDGGDIIRSIVGKAPRLLRHGSRLGVLWMEVDDSHPEAMERDPAAWGLGAGMRLVEWRRDVSGRPRFVCLRRTGA